MKIKSPFLIISLFCICVPTVMAQSIAKIKSKIKKLPLKIEAIHKSIKPKEGVVVLTGEVHVSYMGTELSCERALVFQKQKEIYLSGNVEVKGNGALIKCEEAFYRWDLNKGLMRQARFTNLNIYSDLALVGDIEKVYVSADEVVKEGGDYTVKKLCLSNCGCVKPHWSIKSSSATYTEGEDGVGTVRSWNNVLYAGKVPVFYLPYLWLDTGGDSSGYPSVSVRGGKSSTWGFYGLVNVKANLTKDVSWLIDIDAREDWGMAGGLGYELENDKAKGMAHIYGSNETWRGQESEDRWRAKLEHKQKINSEWGFQVELNTQSDEDMLYDYFRNESNETDGNENATALYRNSKYSYLELYMETRPDDWETETEYLPELRYSYLPRQLGWGGLFYQSMNRAGYMRHRNDDALLMPDYEAFRADTYQEINRPFTLFNLFSSQVYGGYRGTYYSKSQEAYEDVTRGQASWGAQMTYRSFAVFDYNYNPFNVNSVRHVVEPGIAFDSLEDPTEGPDQLLQFDGIDELDYNRVITLRLNNLFQTKRSNKKGGQKNIYQLIDWRLEQKYYVDDKARRINNRSREWGNFYHQVDFTPTEKIRIFNDVEYDAHLGRIDKYSVRLKQYAKSDQWDYQIEQRFERFDHNHLAFSVNNKLSRIYEGGFVIRQDWDDKDHREYGLTLSRRNHCWTIATIIEYNELTDEKKFSVNLWPNFFKDKSVRRYSLW